MQSLTLLALKLWIFIAPLRKDRQLCGLEKYIGNYTDRFKEYKLKLRRS